MAELKLREVGFRYRRAHLWQNLEHEFPGGKWCGLVGPNGCGKSTLLRLLAGWERWQIGQLHVGGLALHGLPPEQRPVVLLTSRPALYSHLTVAENVRLPVRCLGGDDHTAELLGRLQLESVASRYPQELSSGQQQRVGWARALQRPAAWLLADEALANLDGEQRDNVWQVLRQWLPARGTGLLLVTHQLETDLPWLETLDHLHNGELRRLQPGQVFQDPGSLWLARQLCAEWVWPGELLGCGSTWNWVPANAWARVDAGAGWSVAWVRPCTRGIQPGWQVECRGKAFFVPGGGGAGDLRLDAERVRPLTS